jgi:glycosyltransferase involved in cell wall biosynthesis
VGDREVGQLVSVVAICHNHERFVVECLESVRAQTHPNVELVILDDCSTDASLPLIRAWVEANQPDATVIAHDTNQGICRSRNHALALVHGDFVSFISTDDYWLPTKLAHQMDALRRRPEAGAAYSDARQVDEAGAPLPCTALEAAGRNVTAPPDGRIFDLLLVRNFLPPGLLVRRWCLEEVGPYDESLLYEDWDMWLRFSERYEFAFSPGVDVVKRDVATSLSKSLAGTHQTSDLRILLKYADAHPEVWHRVALLAYGTDDPKQIAYFLRRLRHGFSWLVLRFLVQSLTGMRRQRIARIRQGLALRRRARRPATAAGGTQAMS